VRRPACTGLLPACRGPFSARSGRISARNCAPACARCTAARVHRAFDRRTSRISERGRVPVPACHMRHPRVLVHSQRAVVLSQRATARRPAWAARRPACIGPSTREGRESASGFPITEIRRGYPGTGRQGRLRSRGQCRTTRQRHSIPSRRCPARCQSYAGRDLRRVEARLPSLVAKGVVDGSQRSANVLRPPERVAALIIDH
jgi:hypothetical protein